MGMNNNKSMKYFLALLMLLSFFSSCIDDDLPPDQVTGLRPIYLSEAELDKVRSQAPIPYGELGKIVAYEDYIYIGERYLGIHVVNNSDPSNPISEYFWAIPGNVDFTLKDGFLYADNGRDLLTIDVSGPADITVVSKVEDIYDGEFKLNLFPADYSGFFECVDSEQGIVVGWESSQLFQPKCRI